MVVWLYGCKPGFATYQVSIGDKTKLNFLSYTLYLLAHDNMVRPPYHEVMS